MNRGKTLLTFLGTKEYDNVIYRLNGKSVETPYIAEALVRILDIDRVVVFVTEKAMKVHGERFKKAMGSLGKVVNFVRISTPKSQHDVWGIFDKIVGSVCENETIIVDITHAFRHIPFLAFSAILYLREMKGVEVEGIYYGAFDAKDENEAPIFELSGFIEAVEWTYGLRGLKLYGRAEALAEAIGRTSEKIYKNRTVPREKKPRKLSKYAGGIRSLSRLLDFNQIPAFMESAESLSRDYEMFREEVEEYIPPLKYRDSLRHLEELLSFGCSGLCIDKQLDVIEYQIAKGMVANALELEREVIVNIVLKATGEEEWLNLEKRKHVENILNCLVYGGTCEGDEVVKELKELKIDEPLCKIWGKIPNLRNAIAHAGMREKNQRPNIKTLLGEPREILREIKEVWQNLSAS